jgi:hypothetical protein
MHPVLSEVSASVAQGGCMVAFGLPFLAAGTYLGWVTRFHYDQLSFSGPVMPTPLIYGLAALFAVAGLLLGSIGVRAVVVKLGFERRLRRHPKEPWLGDRAWDPQGERERPFASGLRGLGMAAFLVLFLTPFNWWMSADPWIPGILIVGFFDLLPLAYLAYWLYGMGRAIKYGRAWVRYDRFPFYLGETLAVRLGCRGRLDRFAKITVTLRYVVPKREKSGSSHNLVCYQHWAETVVVDPRALTDASVLPIEIALPTGDYGTWLSGDRPRYWEIEAKGEGPGIDFLARFLVPVYARP